MKLRTRFQLLFVVLIIAFAAIAFFTSFSLKKISKLSEIEKNVSQLSNLSLDMKKTENNYFNWDLRNPEYFYSKESKIYNQLTDKIHNSINICNDLKSSDFVKRNVKKGEIDKIIELLNDYSHLFEIIEKNKYELGFEKWGLVGQMNDSYIKLEKVIDSSFEPGLKIKLLSLIKHQKDYLIKRKFSSKELFDRELFSFYESLGSNNRNLVEIKHHLKNFGNVFNNFVDKDNYVGVSRNEGLLHDLENKGNMLDASLNILSLNVSNKTNKHIQSTTMILLIFIIICTSVVLLLGRYIFNRVFKIMGGEPEQVAFIAKNVSKGDLNISLDDKSQYHGLLKSVIVMTQKLRGIISGIYYNSLQLTTTGRLFSENSIKISNGASKISGYTEEISGKIENIEKETAKNSEYASETAGIAEKSKEGMQKIKEQSELSMKVGYLISDKVQIIDRITKQTKILALNAAVEAARAGKYGVGFQVISEEVKRLSEAIKEAAIEINELTLKNQVQSEYVCDLVNNILPSIEKTSELVKNIALANFEQNDNILDIHLIIKKLHEVSCENSFASEKMAENTIELEEQIYSLKNMVSYFKVDRKVTDGVEFKLLDQGSKKKSDKKKKVIKLWKRIKLFNNQMKIANSIL